MSGGKVSKLPTSPTLREEGLEELELLLLGCPDVEGDVPGARGDWTAFTTLEFIRMRFCAQIIMAKGAPRSGRDHLLAMVDAVRVGDAWASVQAEVKRVRSDCHDDPATWPGVQFARFVELVKAAEREQQP